MNRKIRTQQSKYTHIECVREKEREGKRINPMVQSLTHMMAIYELLSFTYSVFSFNIFNMCEPTVDIIHPPLNDRVSLFTIDEQQQQKKNKNRISFIFI